MSPRNQRNQRKRFVFHIASSTLHRNMARVLCQSAKETTRFCHLISNSQYVKSQENGRVFWEHQPPLHCTDVMLEIVCMFSGAFAKVPDNDVKRMRLNFETINKVVQICNKLVRETCDISRAYQVMLLSGVKEIQKDRIDEFFENDKSCPEERMRYATYARNYARNCRNTGGI